jgi:SEL1 protein
LESSSSGSGTLLDTNVFSYYKYLAETGDVQAKLALAQLYLTGGKGVPMDLHEAAKYFTVAAEAGNSQAYAFLGRMYLEGTPATPQNNQTALTYFEKAAEKVSLDN